MAKQERLNGLRERVDMLRKKKITKENRINLLRERMAILRQWLNRCEEEINQLQGDCHFPYTCLEECYCYQNGMRNEEGEPK